MDELTILSIGGSIVAPDGPDTAFLFDLKTAFTGLLQAEPVRLILIIGGGGVCRSYQNACRTILPDAGKNELDWIGIRATWLNAQLVKEIFSGFCPDPLVTNPTADFEFTGRILVAGGWKPGWSTDYIAVILAERFGAGTVVNLSNIRKVYSADPKLDNSARPLDYISWEDYAAMVGEEWTPGKNAPFDPVATKKARELNLRVITAEGRNLANTLAILKGENFEGTVMGRP